MQQPYGQLETHSATGEKRIKQQIQADDMGLLTVLLLYSESGAQGDRWARSYTAGGGERSSGKFLFPKA